MGVCAVAFVLILLGAHVTGVPSGLLALAQWQNEQAAPRYLPPEGSIFVSPVGSDEAEGTFAAPLRTLRGAVRRAASGDTIVLREGTYRESVGMVGKRITIQPYLDEAVWLKGSVAVDDWTRAGTGWEHAGWLPDFCRDCYLPGIIDPEYPLAGKPDMVFLDGEPLEQVAERDDVGPGTFFVDTEEPAIVIGDDPAGKEVEVAAYDHLLQLDGDGAAGSAIRGIGIAQYATRQDYGVRSALVIVNAPDVTIDRVTFAWSASAGLAVFQPRVTVTDSRFGDNGLVGLHAHRADDLKMMGNVFARNNAERFALSGEAIGAAGAKVGRTKRAFVADNVFADNIATGWWCDLGCTDATIVRNFATGNVKHGIYYEVSSGAVIASNVMAGNSEAGMKISSSDEVRVYHNTFTGNGLSLGIYNDPRNPDFDPYSEELGLSWQTARTVLVNNFFAQQRAERPIVLSHDGKPDQAGSPPFVATSDANAYLRSTADAPGHLVVLSLGRGKQGEYPTLAAMRRATGFEEHGIEEPLRSSPFADPQTGDYRLAEGAPGVRAGLPIPEEVVAVLGVDPDDHPDMGMIEGARQG